MKWNLFLLIFALATACGAEKELTGGILVSTDQDGDWEVLVVDPEKGTARQLTDNRAYDTRALWSPDRTRLAFTSDRAEGEAYEAIFFGDEPTSVEGEKVGPRHILVMQTDNSEVFQLTEEGSADHASWSPDGSRITFVNDLPIDDPVPDAEPGERQLFRTYDVEIYAIDPDGGNLQRLTDSPGEDWYPSWSPDGSRISFSSVRTGDWEIYTMDPDGGNLRQLTDSPGEDWDVRWSPDGSHMAFTSKRTGDWEVYTMDPDGGNLRQLTDNQSPDVAPIWSPDGSHIAFASRRTGWWEVYVMAADGSNAERLDVRGIPSDWR